MIFILKLLFIYLPLTYILLSPVPGIVLAFKQKNSIWLCFSLETLICAVTDVIGIFFLWIPAVFHQWKPALSTEWAPDAPIKEHPITVWSWPINDIWGNPEQGLFPNVFYQSWMTQWLRAYLWTAWRNRSNNLKYVFAWPRGPFWLKNVTLFGRKFYAMAGYRGTAGLLVCSAGGGNL